MRNKPDLRSAIGFGILFVLAACSSVPEVTPTALPTVARPTATSHPIGFATARTPPSPTIRPTIDPDFKIEYFKQLLNSEIHACELPCLWDIEPGVSTWTSLGSVFELVRSEPQVPDTYGSKEVLTMLFAVSEVRNSSLVVAFVGNKEIIEYIRVQGSSHPPDHPLYDEEVSAILQRYSVKAVLTEMGPPSEILLDPAAGGGGPGWSLYSILRLYYYEIGVLFEYEFIDPGNTRTVCPDYEKMFSFTLVTSTPDNPGVLSGRIGHFSNIEDITAFSLEEFTELIATSTDSVCFETFDR